jgi:hypothetical protein
MRIQFVSKMGGFNQIPYKKSTFQNFCRRLSGVCQKHIETGAEDIQEGQTEVQTKKSDFFDLSLGGSLSKKSVLTGGVCAPREFVLVGGTSMTCGRFLVFCS